MGVHPPSGSRPGDGVRPSWHRLFRGDTDRTRIQLARNLVVGTAAMAVDFALLILLTERAGLHYAASAAVAFLAATLLRWVLSVAWVFPRRRLESRSAEFFVFAAIGVTGLGLNVLVVWTLTEMTGLPYVASRAVSMVLLFFWNFLLRKWILFR